MTPDHASPMMVTDPSQLESLCDEMAGEEFYAFDTEFHTERTYRPQLALIQLGWGEKVAIVDPLAVDPAPLGRLFAGSGVGIAHAAGQDLDILRTACGAAPSTVFDTQIAAGFLGMSTPSLFTLLERVLGIRISKTDQLSDWLARPIPAGQLAYAAGDVIHLIALRESIVTDLNKRGRLTWALDECAQAITVQKREVDPLEAWWKVSDVRRVQGRSRGIAQEVAAWRERRASSLDRPRRSILPDLAIVTIAQRSPRTRHDLEALRGVEARYLAKGAAAEVLEAIERGRDLSNDDLRLPPTSPETKDSQVAVAVCAGVVRHIADTMRLDQSLLANRFDITQLVNGDPSRLDSGWRRDLAGQQLRRLLSGAMVVAFTPEGDLVLEDRPGSGPASPGDQAKPSRGEEPPR
ncbi:MAG: HRDC domain-containing protein [Actinomycetes bacterium]